MSDFLDVVCGIVELPRSAFSNCGRKADSVTECLRECSSIVGLEFPPSPTLPVSTSPPPDNRNHLLTRNRAMTESLRRRRSFADYVDFIRGKLESLTECDVPNPFGSSSITSRMSSSGISPRNWPRFPTHRVTRVNHPITLRERMRQRLFAGIDGIPSQMMMTFCFFPLSSAQEFRHNLFLEARSQHGSRPHRFPCSWSLRGAPWNLHSRGNWPSRRAGSTPCPR